MTDKPETLEARISAIEAKLPKTAAKKDDKGIPLTALNRRALEVASEQRAEKKTAAEMAKKAIDSVFKMAGRTAPKRTQKDLAAKPDQSTIDQVAKAGR